MKLLTMPWRTATEGGVAQESGVLPQVWATEGALARAVAQMAAPVEAKEPEPVAATVFRTVLAPETAFYRTYTEPRLPRYATLRMESGRVPSMLGREMFRGRVTSYRVHGFDDVVIFVHDVEGCMRLLKPEAQRLIHRVGVQEYTFAETGAMLAVSARTVQRRYYEAVDELTGVFLRRGLLERIASDPCQEAEASARVVSHSPGAS